LQVALGLVSILLVVAEQVDILNRLVLFQLFHIQSR
jgi:hypothetical protein